MGGKQSLIHPSIFYPLVVVGGGAYLSIFVRQVQERYSLDKSQVHRSADILRQTYIHIHIHSYVTFRVTNFLLLDDNANHCTTSLLYMKVKIIYFYPFLIPMEGFSMDSQNIIRAFGGPMGKIKFQLATLTHLCVLLAVKAISSYPITLCTVELVSSTILFTVLWKRVKF